MNGLIFVLNDKNNPTSLNSKENHPLSIH